MTTEEKKQIMIIRQSQLKLVLDWAQTCEKCLSAKELIQVSEVFVDYVSNGYSKEIASRMDKIDEYLNTK